MLFFSKDTVKLQMDKANLEQVKGTDSIKYLGLEFDNYLKFDNQAKHVEKKLNQSSGIIARSSKILTKRHSKLIFNAIVVPTITYGSLNWLGSINKKRLTPINKAYKRTIRSLANFAFRQHCEPICKQEKILKIENIFARESIGFIATLLKLNLPEIIRGNFQNCSTGRLRSQTQNKLLTFSQPHTLADRVAAVWNNNTQCWNKSIKNAKKIYCDATFESYSSSCTIKNCYVCGK